MKYIKWKNSNIKKYNKFFYRILFNIFYEKIANFLENNKFFPIIKDKYLRLKNFFGKLMVDNILK